MSRFSPPSRSKISTIRKNLLTWYDLQKRDLPWRLNSDPYRIWISEVMLQQTRVDQARPFFERFMTTFPTIERLAKRDLDTVLKHWEGLGYYSRARNIHATAQVVCEEHGGFLPRSVDELRRLPGIGSYTAGAIASIAFGDPEPAVDGNVVRVLSRLFALDVDTKDASVRRDLEPVAAKLIDRTRPGDFNQALMELGATVCTPSNPNCQSCPLRRSCAAQKDGSVEQYPRKVARVKVPVVEQIAIVAIDESGRVAVQKRPIDGMLGGLWEFPTQDVVDSHVPRTVDQAAMAVMKRMKCETVRPPEKVGLLRHAYSHFKIRVTVFRMVVSIDSGTPKLSPGTGDMDGSCANDARWLAVSEIPELAVTGVTKRILALL